MEVKHLYGLYPIERMLRDVRLITIWTGTNEVMNLIIQHEFYKEFTTTYSFGRDIEPDAIMQTIVL